MSRRRPARVLAPLALCLALLAVGAMVVSSLGSDGPSGAANGETSTAAERASDRADRPRRGGYRVKAGDTLSGIGEKTNVTVEDLMEFNPDIDPQSLRTGQKLRLRPR